MIDRRPRRLSRLRIAGLAILAPIVLAAVPRSAAAQDAGATQDRLGLIATMPTAVGLLWHITDRFAIRPDVNLSNSNNSAFGASLNVTPSLAVLWYAKAAAPTRAYGALRYAQPRRYADDDTEFGAREASLVIGLQHRMPDKRFALFGELGPSVSWDRAVLGPVEVSNTNVGLRTAIGLAWYP